MLVPAILYKEQISKEFQRKFYTEDMFFGNGKSLSMVAGDIR